MRLPRSTSHRDHDHSLNIPMTAPRKPTRAQRDSHLIRTKINFAQLPMILILKGRKPPRHILAIDPGNAMYRTDRKLEPTSPVIITDHRNMLKP